MKFSERNGYRNTNKEIQIDSVDEELRILLWNVLDLCIFRSDLLNTISYDNVYESRMFRIFPNLWLYYYIKPFDSIPDTARSMYSELRVDFFSCEWYEVYDFIEELIKCIKTESDSDVSKDRLEEMLNSELGKRNSAYRFINGIACEITNKQEIAEVERTLKDDNFPYVKEHLTRALELLSDKQKPDYRNSIKESISAIESIACLLAQKEKATLGDALKELEKKGKLHESLKQGFLKIYGYTSDGDGIRHALMDASDLSKSDAYLFFLLCTSFTNYLKTKF